MQSPHCCTKHRPSDDATLNCLLHMVRSGGLPSLQHSGALVDMERDSQRLLYKCCRLQLCGCSDVLYKAHRLQLAVASWASLYMGGCHNYGPFLGALNIRRRIIIGIHRDQNFDNHPYIHIYIYVYTSLEMQFSSTRFLGPEVRHKHTHTQDLNGDD